MPPSDHRELAKAQEPRTIVCLLTIHFTIFLADAEVFLCSGCILFCNCRVAFRAVAAALKQLLRMSCELGGLITLVQRAFASTIVASCFDAGTPQQPQYAEVPRHDGT